MTHQPNLSFYVKLFSLIIRIREYERKALTNLLTSLKYQLWIYRDRARVSLSLYAAKLFCPKESDLVTFLSSCYKNRRIAHGQIFQDVLAHLVSPKTHGFFVEFGATDGYFLSNTYMLEKSYLWKGILAEPAKVWGQQLKINRGACSIDFRCVWSKSGEKIGFVEDSLPEISGVSTTLDINRMSSNTSRYLVDTVSLMDLLNEHHAPKFIDFLSIDTEGSEYEILEHFDFSRYQFGLIAVEHNFETEKREKLFALLSKNQYKCIFQNLSGCDDWYVPSSYTFQT